MTLEYLHQKRALGPEIQAINAECPSDWFTGLGIGNHQIDFGKMQFWYLIFHSLNNACKFQVTLVTVLPDVKQKEPMECL